MAVSLASIGSAWSAVRRRPARLLAPGWLVAVPLLGWALREAVERLLGVESFPFAAAREPAFLKGCSWGFHLISSPGRR
jgi:hypothetical protein